MKKSLIALAVLAASGAAMAQSSVTLFGVVDAAVTRINGSNGAGNRIGLSQGGNAASRLGFRGTEDLGGGLAASFWLEGTVGVDDGSGYSFDRRSTVSLAGPFGEVRLGRDYSPSFWNITTFDPFGTRGVGQALDLSTFITGAGATRVGAAAVNPTRNNNTIGYFLPATLGGFYGQAQYSFGTEPVSTAVNDKSGRYIGGRLGFANGPLNIAASYGETKQVVPTAGAFVNGVAGIAAPTVANPGVASANLKQASLGASYDFGIVKPLAYISQSKVERSIGTAFGDAKLNTYLLGATAPLGAGELRASIARYDLKDFNAKANKFAIGYGYNLSKRTQVYTTIARLSNKGGSNLTVNGNGSGLAPVANTAAGRDSTGFDIGLRHSF